MDYRTFALMVGLGSVGIVGGVLTACAGTLEDPQRFESGATAAESNQPAPTPAPAAANPCGDVPKDLLLVRCATAGCHTTKDAYAGLDLESPDVLTRLAGKSATGGAGVLIDPQDPDKSLVYTKCTSSPPFGSTMPTVPLDAAALACVKTWVETAKKAP